MIGRHSYRGVIFVLIPAAILAAISALVGGTLLGNPVLLDTAVALVLSTGVLVGIVLTGGPQARLQTGGADEPDLIASTPGFDPKSAFLQPSGRTGVVPDYNLAVAEESGPTHTPTEPTGRRFRSRLLTAAAQLREWRAQVTVADVARISTGVIGGVAVVLAFRRGFALSPPLPLVAAVAATLTLAAAGLAVTVAQYLAGIDPADFPEAPGLCRGARVLVWILVLAAISIGLAWARQQTAIRVIHLSILAVVAILSASLLSAKRQRAEAVEAFPLDFGLLSVLGSRPNMLASVLDSAEAQLGIDLRSTWALVVVRRSLEPLAFGLALLGWLSTSLTVVGLEEQGLVQRLGVPVGVPLQPGLHVHWPWPIDQVPRLPVQRVQLVRVGHQGEKEAAGPEDVLWARQHAENEYTLLLGDGRDLITIDAAVQFRIADTRAWLYRSQNPAEALRAIAYRAVMRSTVNLTLSQVLSQNVVTLTTHMRAMVQQDADALGLGVEVLGFTVGGMHPPVPVAAAYQAVGSAEIGKATAVINANAFRNRNVPSAEAAVLTSLNTARSEAAENAARASGEAWSFRALDGQYRAAREDYSFRRRLETLEKGLFARRFTVVDVRFERDGGELWTRP